MFRLFQNVLTCSAVALQLDSPLGIASQSVEIVWLLHSLV